MAHAHSQRNLLTNFTQTSHWADMSEEEEKKNSTQTELLVIGEAAPKKLLTTPLSNDPVSHRITDMALDIQHHPLMSQMVHCCWFLFNCVGVCSDGAASITGRHHGVIRQILDRAPVAKWTHCVLHCESLAAKNMLPEFHDVMDVSVKTINFIKNNAVNSSCFAELCEDMEADHVHLLCHSEVTLNTTGLFLQRKKISSCTLLLNSNMFFIADKVEAFKRKLALWTKRVQEKTMDMFPLLSHILENSPQVKVSDSVDEYFPEDPREAHMWILDPFSIRELSTDSTLKLQWGKLGLGSFWIAVSKEYLCLALRAVKLLLPFTTTYHQDQSPKQIQSNSGSYSESDPFLHSTQTGSDGVSGKGELPETNV
uniref:DUF4371 domain-containing protein n=1 Tax=Maylandia zebra TaxID=106582 RepID=A0A3P9AWE9_9CICH